LLLKILIRPLHTIPEMDNSRWDVMSEICGIHPTHPEDYGRTEPELFWHTFLTSQSLAPTRRPTSFRYFVYKIICINSKYNIKINFWPPRNVNIELIKYFIRNSHKPPLKIMHKQKFPTNTRKNLYE
jgi:hypothetical protein